MERNDMLKDPKIDAIVFYVKDIKRAEAFYRDVLGLATKVMPPHADPGEEPVTWMRADAGQLTLVFFERNEKPGRTPIVVFGLEKGGIDAIVEQLAKKGVQIVVPVSEAPGGWSADFLDPDGHMLSFYQSDKAPR
jgi:predicted enzyme related to lactoylglutathione lyase